MVSKVLKKINAKLKFLYCQISYSTPAHRRLLLCNALIQPHFHHGCSMIKLQKAQNKCTCFCLNLPPRFHFDPSHFRKIYWLLVSERLEYCIVNAIFKCWNGIVQGYIIWFSHSNIDISCHHWYPFKLFIIF